MSLIPTLALAVLSLAGAEPIPPPAVAAGVAAYARGDFTTALAVLKPIAYDVSDPSNRLTLPHAWAAAYLAQMFRRGEGTAPDWPLSCALFSSAWAFAPQRGPGPVVPLPFVAEGIQEVCGTDRQEEVMALRTACFLDGVTRWEFVLDGGAWIVVDRLGFHLDLAGEHRDRGLSTGCHEVIVSLTEADVSIPHGSGQRVHLLELFKWTNGFDKSGHIIRQLHWIVYGVKGTALGVATDQTVLTVIGGPYPSLEMPPGVREAAVLRVNRAGDVEWIVRGPRERRGLIPKE